MKLNFHERCLILAMLHQPNRRVFIHHLEEMLKTQHMDRDLRDSVVGLVDKFEKLSDAQVYNLYQDRLSGEIRKDSKYIIK